MLTDGEIKRYSGRGVVTACGQTHTYRYVFVIFFLSFMNKKNLVFHVSPVSEMK